MERIKVKISKRINARPHNIMQETKWQPRYVDMKRGGVHKGKVRKADRFHFQHCQVKSAHIYTYPERIASLEGTWACQIPDTLVFHWSFIPSNKSPWLETTAINQSSNFIWFPSHFTYRGRLYWPANIRRQSFEKLYFLVQICNSVSDSLHSSFMYLLSILLSLCCHNRISQTRRLQQ